MNWVCFEHWFIAELIEHGMLQQESQFFKLFVHLDSRADSAAQLSLIGIFWFFISQRNLHINNFRKFECWKKPWIASSAPWITRTWNLRKNRELQIRELRNRELRGSPVSMYVIWHEAAFFYCRKNQILGEEFNQLSANCKQKLQLSSKVDLAYEMSLIRWLTCRASYQ